MHDLSDKPKVDGNQLSIGSAIERYLNFPGTNPKTRCNIRLRLNNFAQFMAEKHGAVRSVEELEKKHVTDFMLMMREAGTLPSAIGHLRSTIYGWLQFLGERGFVDENVAKTIRPPKLPAHLPTLPPRRNLASFFTLNVSTGWPERDAVIREMLRYCSPPELVALNVDDIDLGARTVNFRLRPDCLRLRPMDGYLTGLLEQYRIHRAARMLDRGILNPESVLPMFVNWDLRGWERGTEVRLTTQSVKSVVTRLGEAAGINNLTPKVLRSVTAVEMFEKGAEIHHVQELLGHRSPEAVIPLRKLAGSRLRNEVARTHPLYANGPHKTLGRSKEDSNHPGFES